MPLDLIPNYMSMHDLKLGKEDVELTITLGNKRNIHFGSSRKLSLNFLSMARYWCEWNSSDLS